MKVARIDDEYTTRLGGSGSLSSGTPVGGDLDGTLTAPTVSGITGTPITGTPTTDGVTLVYNSTTNTFVYQTIGGPSGVLGNAVGPILIADIHSTPIVFADFILTEDEDDLLYADP